MNPYLTHRGRWVLLSGAVFLLAGAALSNPLILVLGQVQIALLAVAFMLLVPGALALDRRRIECEVVEEDDAQQNTAEKQVTGMLAGEHTEARLRVRNHAPLGLYGVRFRPFGAPELELEAPRGFYDIPGQRSVELGFGLQAARAGRWTLHGLDVEIADPLGLIETRDYLPCTHHYEFYPRVIRIPRTSALPRGGAAEDAPGGRHLLRRLGMGTDVVELREHQPGDPLRNIAWKATARQRKLIDKNFEQEVARSVYILLDISSSMRGGQQPGQKLDFAVAQTVLLAQSVLRDRDSVGLMTFDEKLYGHVPAGSSPAHLRRMLHHLVGLHTIVDPDLTEFDDSEVERSVVDYLLVQERLDFRKGKHVDQVTGINGRLLQQWLRGVGPANERRYDSETLDEGVVAEEGNLVRRFAQLRGVNIPYRVEARLGMKERGLVEALEALARLRGGRRIVVIISDLCGIMNMELLSRGVRLAQIKGHQLKVLMPFTPAFYDRGEELGPKYAILKELFTSAEREERARVVQQLRALGVEVELMAPLSARRPPA